MDTLKKKMHSLQKEVKDKFKLEDLNETTYNKLYDVSNDIALNGDNNINKIKLNFFCETFKNLFTTNPEQFFLFLRTHVDDGIHNEVIPVDVNVIRSNITYELIAFRTYICELIYNAVQLFPEISEYTIECSNNITNSKLILGTFTDIDDTDMPCCCKIITTYDTFVLNKVALYNIFIANKIHNPDYSVTNGLIMILTMSGWIPIVKTSYKMNKSMISKFKYT